MSWFTVNSFVYCMLSFIKKHLQRSCTTCWRHPMETFSALLAICAGKSPHKGQWRGALIFSLICTWIKGCWENNHEAGDLKRHRTHYDVTVMKNQKYPSKSDFVNFNLFCDIYNSSIRQYLYLYAVWNGMVLWILHIWIIDFHWYLQSSFQSFAPYPYPILLACTSEIAEGFAPTPQIKKNIQIHFKICLSNSAEFFCFSRKWVLFSDGKLTAVYEDIRDIQERVRAIEDRGTAAPEAEPSTAANTDEVRLQRRVGALRVRGIR